MPVQPPLAEELLETEAELARKRLSEVAVSNQPPFSLCTICRSLSRVGMLASSAGGSCLHEVKDDGLMLREDVLLSSFLCVLQ